MSLQPVPLGYGSSAWLALRALGATAWLTARGLWEQYAGRLDPQRADTLLYGWAIQLLRLARVQLAIEGLSEGMWVPGRPHVMVSNHTSLYDIPIIFAAFPGYTIRMIGKKELFQIPLFGTAIRRAGFLPVDRENRAQSRIDMARAQDQVAAGCILWGAPEGTRSRNGELGPLKQGLFRLAIAAQARIIPVWIGGAAQILPAKQCLFTRDVSVRVSVLPVVDTAEPAFQNKAHVMDIVRTRFEAAAAAFPLGEGDSWFANHNGTG